jgi:hypothetical protein
MGTHETQRAMRALKAIGAAVLAGGMLSAATRRHRHRSP